MVAIRWRTRCGGRTAVKGATPPYLLKYARMSVAMALAEARHHTAPRGQTTARAEATNDAPRSQTTSVAGDTEFFSLYGEELWGTRPDRLYEVRPQERVQRRTVEQNVDNSLFLPTLDVPVPQMENQLVRYAGCSMSSSRHSHRRRVRFAEQTAEQLVEVPTIISYSSLRGIVEQISFQQRLPSRTLTFQFLVVAEIFLLHRRLPVCRVRQIKGFFALFPEGKKCDDGSALGVGTGCGHQLIHAGGSAGGFLRGRSRCVDAISRWLVETSGLGPRSLAAWVKTGTGPSSCVSLRLLVEEFRRVFLSFVLAQFALGIWYIISFVLASGSYVPGVWVLLRSTEIEIFGRCLFPLVQCFVQQWIHVLRELWMNFTHFPRGGGLDS